MSPLKAKCQIKCIHTITVVWLAWNLCQPLFRDIQKTSNSGDLIFKDAWTRTDWRLNPSMPQLDSSQSCPDISSIPCEHSMWRMGKSRNVGAESQGRVKYSENINVGTRKGYDLVKSVTPLQSERIRKEPKGSERIQFGKADGWLSKVHPISLQELGLLPQARDLPPKCHHTKGVCCFLLAARTKKKVVYPITYNA